MQHDTLTTGEGWTERHTRPTQPAPGGAVALAAQRGSMLPLGMRKQDHAPLFRSLPYPLCAWPARHVSKSHG